MRRPRILILSFSPLATDPRVSRQIDLLAADYDIVAAGFSAPLNPNVTYVALSSRRQSITHRLGSALRLLARKFDSYYWRIDSVRDALSSLASYPFDLILANDPDTWPLAHVLARKTRARLLFDAHEYAPRELEDLLSWRLTKQAYRTALCRRYLPEADGMITVCNGIADEYARVFGITRPHVVMNTPSLQKLVPSTTSPDHVRMVHHGGASRSRRIETMIRMMDRLDARFTLDLILVPTDASYLKELRAIAQGNPRVRFPDPVAMPEIPAKLNSYDLGLYLLDPNSFNNRHALPNKLFEFVQARLAVAIGPSPEMAHLVKNHQLGVISSDFSPEALAASLNALTPSQIDGFKTASHRAAPLLSWDHERTQLQHEVSRLLALNRHVKA